jgi:hypothetical protein
MKTFSSLAIKNYNLMGAQFPVHHLSRKDCRKIVIKSLKFLTSLINTRLQKEAKQAKFKPVNFETVFQHEYPIL